MNMTVAEADKLIAEVIGEVKDAYAEVVVCVPYTDLKSVGEKIKGTNIKLGAQNVSWANSGAFTGEISAAMLKELGVEYVIIGHSERRQMFGETNETVDSRTIQALKNGLTPIVCVGETEREREDGLTESVLFEQVTKGLKGISPDDMAKVVIAYEPVWAIGTGKTATKEDANNTIGYIREVLGKLCEENAAKIVIQYGGSMNAANAAELMAMPEIDGGLIGGASLKAKDFGVVVKAGDIKKS